jgi:hypothetical protein
MRLRVVKRGHRVPQKLAMRMIRIVSRDPSQPQDIIRTMLYRPEFFGRQVLPLVQAAMRGPSERSAGERELFAAFTPSLNHCCF